MGGRSRKLRGGVNGAETGPRVRRRTGEVRKFRPALPDEVRTLKFDESKLLDQSSDPYCPYLFTYLHPNHRKKILFSQSFHESGAPWCPVLR
jgi:hypothetical protein